jgi:hypothetical protein
MELIMNAYINEWLVLAHYTALTIGLAALAIALVREALRWLRRRWFGRGRA